MPNFPKNLTYFVFSQPTIAQQQNQAAHKKQLEAFFFSFLKVCNVVIFVIQYLCMSPKLLPCPLAGLNN